MTKAIELIDKHIILTNCRIPMINLAHSELMMEWKVGKKKQIL